ncbi:hypothetical protein QZH41_006125 [Actinostola sp. cb2023]|nr:hypothetical protein QZH41_006125 [Actinostola sp. cb2023]
MAFIVSYSLVFILSVVGNAYIIAIVLRNKQMHSTINYLIANMASSDLAGSVAAISPILSYLKNMSYEWKVAGTMGSILCKAGPFIRDVSITVSILSMIAIGFDRFFAVIFPMNLVPRFLTIRIALPVIWFIAIATFSIHLVTFRLVPLLDAHLCYMAWPDNLPDKSSLIFFLAILILYFILPFVIITILYLAIAHTIKQQKIPGQQSTDIEKKRRKQNHGIIKMAFTIVACFFVCWFPYHTLLLLELFVWKRKENIPAALLPFYGIFVESTIILSYVSFFINPFVCFFFSSKFRKYLRNLFPFNIFAVRRIGIMDSSSRRNDASFPQRQHTTMLSMNIVHSQQDDDQLERIKSNKAEN